jgi:hypothetical protein
MTTFDSLNDGQRATLQLLLKQGKSYDEIAAMLKLNSSAVQSRAHEAVAALGPAGPDLGDDRRREIADYLLGQQSASRRAATRVYLEDSAEGRVWARAVAGALRPLAGDRLPEVPAEPAEVDEAFEALDRRTARQQQVQASSQLGTRIIFGVLGLAVAVGLILVFGIFSGDDTPKTKTATITRTAPPVEKPQVVLQGTMKAPSGSASKASAQMAIVRYASDNKFKLVIGANGLQPPPAKTAYGIWLYATSSQHQFVGFPKGTVNDKGQLAVLADISSNTPTYPEVLLTRETVQSPANPGDIVLQGKFVIPAALRKKLAQQNKTQTQP